MGAQVSVEQVGFTLRVDVGVYCGDHASREPGPRLDEDFWEWFGGVMLCCARRQSSAILQPKPALLRHLVMQHGGAHGDHTDGSGDRLGVSRRR
jgi:hypothetical protein